MASVTGGKQFEIVTKGFRELEDALTRVTVTVDAALGQKLRKLAEPVKADVQRDMAGWEPVGMDASIRGVRIRRRSTRITVEQMQRKTTGFHPNYGDVQMRHFFLPALAAHADEIERGVEELISELVALG